MWNKFKIPRAIILTAEDDMKRNDAYTETIIRLELVPDAKASENKQTIMSALNNIELSESLTSIGSSEGLR